MSHDKPPPRPPPPSFRQLSSKLNQSNNEKSIIGSHVINQLESKTTKTFITSSFTNKGSEVTYKKESHGSRRNSGESSSSSTADVRVEHDASSFTQSDREKRSPGRGLVNDGVHFKRGTVALDATPLTMPDDESDEDELIFQAPASSTCTQSKNDGSFEQFKDIQNFSITKEVNTTYNVNVDTSRLIGDSVVSSPQKLQYGSHPSVNNLGLAVTEQNHHINTGNIAAQKEEREPFFRYLKREQVSNNSSNRAILRFSKSSDDVVMDESTAGVISSSRDQLSYQYHKIQDGVAEINEGSNENGSREIERRKSDVMDSGELRSGQFDKRAKGVVSPAVAFIGNKQSVSKSLSASEGNQLQRNHDDSIVANDRQSKVISNKPRKNVSQLTGSSQQSVRQGSGDIHPNTISLSALLQSQRAAETKDMTSSVAISHKKELPVSATVAIETNNRTNVANAPSSERELKLQDHLKSSLPSGRVHGDIDDDDYTVSATAILRLSFCIFVVYALPISPFWHGLLSGVIIAYFLGAFCIWLSMPSYSPEENVHVPPRPPPFHYSYVSRLQQTTPVKGWMYGKRKYDQSQHYKTDLRCIYARLDGTVLRLSKPQSDDLTLPFKPEKWNVPFINQKLLDIVDAKIQLVPKHLTGGKLWSKKYPICITLAKGRSFKGAPTTNVDRNPIEYQPGSVNKIQLPKVDPNVSNDEGDQDRSFYLFAPTSHDKEYWFYRLKQSAECHRDDLTLEKENRPYTAHLVGSHKRSKSLAEMQAIYYSRYMAKLILQVENRPKGKQQITSSKGQTESSIVSWLNALLGRAFFDFWREQYWSDKMVAWLQRRLNKLNRPGYIKELVVTELDLGGSLPTIRGASAPTLDERGLWIDLEISYHGSFTLTLETSLNITRNKTDGDAETTADSKKDQDATSKGDALYTLQGLDKSESESSDDDIEENTAEKLPQGSSSSQPQHNSNGRWSRFIKKVGKSKIVQKATNSRLAQRAAEKVSNIPIVLAVEVQSLNGILAINMAPPPSDRFWYGFRGNPTVLMSVRPKVGERKVRLTNITDWIEKRLRREIKETIVLPHMIDLKIPIMGNGMTEIPIALQQ